MDAAVNGVKVIRTVIDSLKNSGTAVSAYDFPRPGRDDVYPKITFASRFEPWNLVIATGAYTDDIAASFLSLPITVVGLLLGVVGLSVLASVLIARSITRPLDSLGQRMHTLADGDLASPIAHTERGDEVGRMARIVAVFRQALIAKGEMDVALARDAEAKVERAHALDSLTRQFEGSAGTMMHGLASAATAMQTNAAAMAQTSARSAQVAEAAQET